MAKIKNISKKKIKELYLSGLTTTKIAVKLGCTSVSIRQQLISMNIKLRRTGPFNTENMYMMEVV